jgi:hypothetical protein
MPLGNLNPLRRVASKAGSVNAERSTFWTTPWAWRDNEGCYIGHNKEVWLYRTLTVAPIVWEDPQRQIEIGSPLASMLYELAETSKDLGVGIRALSRSREIHLLSVNWEENAVAPDGTPEELTEFLDATLNFTVPNRALVIGVKLWSSISAPTNASKGLITNLRNRATTLLQEDVPDLSHYDSDRRVVSEILSRNGASYPPDRTARSQMESWYNFGNGPDVTVLEAKDVLVAGQGDRIEMAAVMSFDTPRFLAPEAPWALMAQTHQAGASVISVRGTLEPSSISRNRVRRAERKVLSQIEEEAATGDIERPEQAETFQLAQDVERFIISGREPLIANCSILMARRVGPEVPETYIDELRAVLGIEMKPLEHRQMAALDETLPCSSKRVNPFLQDVSVAMLAHAGLQGFSNLGDRRGAYLGLVDPDYVPCYLDPLGAPAANLPPGMLIAGEPGSGKAQPLDAKILTPTGWTTMGEIKVGDEVIGSDGKPHQVLGVFPQGEKLIYKVTFNDGSSTEACGEHLWAVRTSIMAWRGTPWKVLDTETLRESLIDNQGKRRWTVPVVQPVDHPEADLPLDPYALGLLLGDGNLTHQVAFSSSDPELVTALAAALPPGCEVVHRSRYDHNVVDRTQRGNRVIDTIRLLGLSGHRSEKKFIPTQYQFASVAQRYALLQGLLDSDGHVTNHNSIEYATSSPDLAEQTADLVRSLGGVARIRSKIPTFTVKGKESGSTERRTGRRSYTVTIRLPRDLGNPFRLARKARQYQPQNRFEPGRVITDITPVGVKQAQCIKVSASDNLYVTDDYVLTHNTFAAQMIALQSALAGHQTIFVNPKSDDTLEGLTDLVDGTVIRLSQVEAEGGYFDPFRFCQPDPAGRLIAADILSQHILAVLGSRGVAGQGFTQEEEIAVIAGLRAGAERGAQCAAQAIACIENDSVKNLIAQQATDPLFRLGIGMTPQPSYASDRRLLLIEFDKPLDIPEKGIEPSQYTRTQRLAVAAVRLVTRASMEILANASGGVIIVDEAWMYLQSSEGLAALQSFGRLGRSKNILPIFATQRIDDLVKAGVDMEGYLSRVLVLKLTEEREATAALRLCGLEATPARIAWLRDAGAIYDDAGRLRRGAMGLHRDLKKRHAAVMIGPVPENARLAFSTNPEDRARRKAALLAAEQPPALP